MEQRSLRVIETNKTFFTKITSTISKILIPTKVGFNGIMISMKRNNVLKAYQNYKNAQSKENTKDLEQMTQKYEECFALYLESIDKYIMDSVYKKVKNGTATNFEKDALSKYYLVVSLKNKQYLEYKYKKQEYLLRIDYESASQIKKESLLNKYKEFYVSKMDFLYKGLLKNYSVELSDNVKGNTQRAYNKIFETLETYVTEILPIKISINTENKKLVEEYEKYEHTTVGKLDERDRIIQKMILLGISRQLFTHSLPLVATEKCYIKILKDCRQQILKNSVKLKREKAYQTFFEVSKDYNEKLLATKIYWEDIEQREAYKDFWKAYKEAENDENVKEKQEILFLKYDVKMLNKNEAKYAEIIKIHKNKLVELGAMKTIKNTFKSENKYIVNKSILKSKREYKWI